MSKVTLPTADETAAVTRLAGGFTVYATSAAKKAGGEWYSAGITYPGIPLSWGRQEVNITLTKPQLAAIAKARALGIPGDAFLDALVKAATRANEWRDRGKPARPDKPVPVSGPRLPQAAAAK